MLVIFQSTPPARGATHDTVDLAIHADISIHAPREGGDAVSGNDGDSYYLFQSTPPARGATLYSYIDKRIFYISIHAPREGGDVEVFAGRFRYLIFQSTPPARGATSGSSWMISGAGYFNPRPPRGGRQLQSYSHPANHQISIHAPREGGDHGGWSARHRQVHFNPRPPRGGRHQDTEIGCLSLYFNPRPPRGGRQQRCTVLPADF